MPSLFIGSLLSFIHLNIVAIPNAHVGLLKEKTRGWDKIYLTQGYHWIWTYFIPLKWKLHLLDLEPPVMRVKFQSPLKYSRYLQLSDVFDVLVEMEIQYKIDTNKIRSLLQSLDEEVDQLSNYVKEKITLLLELKYLEYYSSDRDIPLIKAKMSNYIKINPTKVLFTLIAKKSSTPMVFK